MFLDSWTIDKKTVFLMFFLNWTLQIKVSVTSSMDSVLILLSTPSWQTVRNGINTERSIDLFSLKLASKSLVEM